MSSDNLLVKESLYLRLTKYHRIYKYEMINKTLYIRVLYKHKILGMEFENIVSQDII